MSATIPALEALLVALTARGSPLARLLRPGLAADYIMSRMADIGATPHGDVVSLYEWHDGFDRFRVPTGAEGMVALSPSHREFNSLDETLKVFARRREMADALQAVPQRQADGSVIAVDPDQVWSGSWFPVFEGGGSEVIYISNKPAAPGSVWLHPVQDAPRRLYDSLADAADAVRFALTDGRLVLDSAGAFFLEQSLRSGIEI